MRSVALTSAGANAAIGALVLFVPDPAQPLFALGGGLLLGTVMLPLELHMGRRGGRASRGVSLLLGVTCLCVYATIAALGVSGGEVEWWVWGGLLLLATPPAWMVFQATTRR